MRAGGKEPGPKVARPEPTSPLASTPDAPTTRGPSALTPRPEVTQGEQEPAATPGIPDPIHQEPIPNSLNTIDISFCISGARKASETRVRLRSKVEGQLIRLSGLLWVLSPEVGEERSDPSKPIYLAKPRKNQWKGFASGSETRLRSGQSQ